MHDHPHDHHHHHERRASLIVTGTTIPMRGPVTTAPPGRRSGRRRIGRGEEPVPSEPALQDLDLVEASFVEGFLAASDPTSFLRLAGIPFVATDADGHTLHLLRCEIEDRTDVGAVSPLMGGQGMRYDPLPKAFVSRRRSLAFAYHDGGAVRRLGFAAARALAPAAEGLEVRLNGAGASWA